MLDCNCSQILTVLGWMSLRLIHYILKQVIVFPKSDALLGLLLAAPLQRAHKCNHKRNKKRRHAFLLAKFWICLMNFYSLAWYQEFPYPVCLSALFSSLLTSWCATPPFFSLTQSQWTVKCYCSCGRKSLVWKQEFS